MPPRRRLGGTGVGNGGSPGARAAAEGLQTMARPQAEPPRSTSAMDDLFASAVPVAQVASPQMTLGGRVAAWLERGGSTFAQKHLPKEDDWRVIANGGGEVRLCAQLSAPPWSFLMVLEADSEVRLASEQEESQGRRAIRRHTPLPAFKGMPLLRVGDGKHMAFASFRTDEARDLQAGGIIQVRHAARR